jgi:hypothetical protein
MDRRGNAEYRRLVETLMHLGWYRQGEAYGLADHQQPCWMFRSGHTLDEPTATRRCITASNEMAAMRSLLHELEQPVAASSGSD